MGAAALPSAEGYFSGSGAKKKASSTPRDSQAVPHPSTNRALRRLTAEFGRDPVYSTRYGRWRKTEDSGDSRRKTAPTCGRKHDGARVADAWEHLPSPKAPHGRRPATGLAGRRPASGVRRFPTCGQWRPPACPGRWAPRSLRKRKICPAATSPQGEDISCGLLTQISAAPHWPFRPIRTPTYGPRLGTFRPKAGSVPRICEPWPGASGLQSRGARAWPDGGRGGWPLDRTPSASGTCSPWPPAGSHSDFFPPWTPRGVFCFPEL